MDSKNKMLIDATHPEETRVVALRNGRVEEFDFESAARKLLRGNIYLAKVTRVEPSLQAAFIDYGGNRHGFLAFNEIHPDYYQIPVADREALKQEEAEAERWAEAEVEERARSRSGPRRRRRPRNDRGNGNGNGHGRQESREDLSAEVDTFEDGYQTSVASVDDVEQDQGASSAELRHEISPDDVRHAEVDHHESSAAREETTQPAHEHTAPGQAHHEHHGHEQQGQEHGAPEHAAPGHEPHSHGHQAEHSHAPEAHGHGPSVESTADLKAPEPHVEAAPEVRSADASPSSDWGPAEHYAAAPEYAAEARVAAPRHADADDADDHMDGNGHGAVEDDTVEQVSTEEDALEELPERPRRRARQYKIQEVIKRRQIMLVQVVKEERGNKGAALTTYISLAGRFTVLMPNTARGGGISRKITQPQDRKRLKAIAEELDVPEGMGLIIRTAGAARTKEEIKRDYEYLLRLWERVRDLTLSSTAPCVVYEEGNIIKRAIRDLYSKEFDQIVVAGESAHREAQDFMEMLMPGTGNQVASYRAPEPLFARYGIERQLNALFSPYVTLRSGGYIVINQTEALVSVDVNSGKSTREFSIEETALNTNLEAAEEIARQLKLRDLAGLIVVDFIDMEEKRNNRSVERRLKDALRHDRARIQVGRISHFGLLEMSRQRLRAGVLEGSTSQCPHCQGTGIIRSIESVALAVLRGLEDHLLKQATSVIAQTTAEVALYILNHKRAFITEMERRYGVIVRVEASDRVQGANFAVERFATPVSIAKPGRSAVSMEAGFDRDEDLADEADEAVAEPIAADVDHDGGDERGPRAAEGSEDERRGRRRRRRRGRRDREGEPRGEAAAAGHALREAGESEGPAYEVANGAAGSDTSYDEGVDDLEPAEASEPLEPSVQEAGRTEGDGEGDGERRRGRRRGRRGGRSRRREGGEQAAPVAAGSDDDSDRHEWGIAEVARPGAEQPSASNPWHDRPVGLVGSADATAGGEERASPARPSIVEHVNEEASFAKSGAEALASAAALAGWQQTETAPAMPVAPPAAQPRPRPVEAAPVEPPVAEVTPIVPPEPFAAVAGHAVEAATEQPAAAHSSNGAYSHAEPAPEATPPAPTSVGPIETPEPQPARRGWWQRRFGGAE